MNAPNSENTETQQNCESTGSDSASRCPLVALGASAGGLEVFQQFFDQMPADSGMAFILLQHLDPSHDTLMPELLAKHTSMKVLRAEDGSPILANHVYVISPSTSLQVDGCKLRTSPLSVAGDRKVIDHFFRSAAQDQRENVVAIVLSGTGCDGTVGLRAIKEWGGLTIAQSPDTAQFDSMPRSAISTGCVDHVMPVKEMPRRIIEYIEHLTRMHLRSGVESFVKDVERRLPEIFPILKEQTGHDFSRYKQSTLIRRIQRRMQIVYLDSVERYIEYLRANAQEVDALFKDLLIGVTQFFRDAQSFDFLAQNIIPALFQNKGSKDHVRVWIPGCASGEEAYSFAIMLCEHAARLDLKPQIQIFATDLDAEALDHARRGKYPEDIEQQMSPDRLNRFFKKNGSIYEVVDHVREFCVFSPHNVIKDPPFSRLDLISCRNLLIYLEADLQKKLLPLFHYALNPSGYLFLGPSENIASRSELFRTVDAKHRIFQRKPTTLRSFAPAPLLDSGRVTKLQALVASTVVASKEPALARSIERVIIEEYAPAGVVANKEGEVLYFTGNTGKFLEPPAGTPSNNILSMARKNLRLELRTAFHRAVTSGEETLRENIRIKVGRDVIQIDLVVRPLPELGPDPELFIILFRELIPSKDGGRPALEDFSSQEHPVIRQLENELRTTKEDLQTTIEELETSNEELKSANEELLSMNEELQSANEELQTSKEEVQAANDELSHKIEEVELSATELRKAHEDRARLAAIVQNSDDAIVGKTLDGIVTSWNRGAQKVFGYTAAEMVGQSITKIIPPERLDEEKFILSRLRQGLPVEHFETERVAKDGRRLIISLTSSPIRDAHGMVVGAAKIARDITERRAAEEARLRLASVVESSDDAIITKTLDGIITSWNKAAERIYGYTAHEVIGKSVTVLMPPERVDEEPAIIQRLKKGEKIDHYETIRRRKDGSLIDISLTVSPIKDGSGQIIGASKIARDITARKKAEEARLRLAAVVDSSEDAIISKTLDGIITTWNQGAERMFGYRPEEIVGQHITILFPPERVEEEQYVIDNIRRGIPVKHFQTVRKHKSGKPVDVSLTVSPIKDPLGNVIGVSKIARDISMQKQAERTMQENADRLQLALAAGGLGDWKWTAHNDMVVLSDQAADIFGLPHNQPISWSNMRNLLHPEDQERARIAVEQAMTNKSTYSIEYRVRRPNGEACWISARGKGTYHPDGKPLAMIGVVQDITERKRTEEALKQSMGELQTMFRQAAVGIAKTSLDGRIVQANSKFSSILGYSEPELCKRKVTDLVCAEDVPVVERIMEDLKFENIPEFLGERCYIRNDGTKVWTLTSVGLLKDKAGKPSGFIRVIEDVSEQKHMQETLQEERRILELLNDTGKIIASQLNIQSLLQQVTDAATKLSGANFGAFFYNTINEKGEALVLYTLSGAPREAFEKFGVPRATPMFSPTFHGEGIIRSDDVLKDPRYGKMAPHHGMPKGHLPVRSYLAVPVISRSGEVIGGLFFGHRDPGMFTERSERLVAGVAAQAAVAMDNARLYEQSQKELEQRKQAEKALQQANESLEKRVQDRTASLRESRDQLETFCYTIAHDLRSPLRAQQSFAQVLLDDYSSRLDDDGKDYASRILQNAHRLDKLVSDLLAYARLSQEELTFKPVDLRKLVPEVNAALADEIRATNATIDVGELHVVTAYEPTLSLVITNLLSNALKFVDPGVRPDVKMYSESNGETVRFWVEDKGIGIASEHIPKLFGVFQRLHKIGKYTGTGIGLAIVQKGITRMGGKVGVESVRDKGSRFWIELPAAQA